MGKPVFGAPVTAIDVECPPVEPGPTDFVRLWGALIGAAPGGAGVRALSTGAGNRFTAVRS
jgi:hypothetical protein